MAFCGNCGSPSSPEQQFCGTCGAAQAPTTGGWDQPPPQQELQQAPDQQWSDQQWSDQQWSDQQWSDQQWSAQPPPQQPPPQQPPPQQQWGGPQYGAPGAQGPGYGPPAGPPRQPSQAGEAVRKVLLGNWIGAGLVAAVVLGSAGLTATALGLLAKPDDFGLRNTLMLIAQWTVGAFGADFVLRPDGSWAEGAATIGAAPVTISLVALAAGIVMFRRVTNSYTSLLAAASDGVRAGLIVAVPCFLFALVMRSNTEDLPPAQRTLLDGFGGEDSILSWGPSRSGALFLTIVTVAFFLVLALLQRREFFTGRWERVHTWLAAPLTGVGVMLLLLPVVGLIGFAAVLVLNDLPRSDTDFDLDETLTAIGFLVAYLANLGFSVVTVGSGASLSYDYEAETESGGGNLRESGAERLAYFAGDGDLTGLWVALLLMPLWLLAGAWVVARRSPSHEAILPNLLRWAGLMVVLVPWLTYVTSVRADVDAEGDILGGELDLSTRAGSDGLEATLLLVLFSLVAVPLVALMYGALDLRTLSGQASAFARSIQTHPGAGGPGQQSQQGGQPGRPGQQWGATPPQQQGWGQQHPPQHYPQQGPPQGPPQQQWVEPEPPTAAAPPGSPQGWSFEERPTGRVDPQSPPSEEPTGLGSAPEPGTAVRPPSADDAWDRPDQARPEDPPEDPHQAYRRPPS